MTHAERVSKKLLAPGEKLEMAFGIGSRHLRFHYGKIALWATLFVFGVAFPFGQLIPYGYENFSWVPNALLAALFGIFLLMSVTSWLREKYAILYLLTDRRLVMVKGFFAIDSTSIDYNKITDVEIDETLSEKIVFKTATLKIRVDSEGGRFFTLGRIQDYSRIQQIIYSHKIYRGGIAESHDNEGSLAL